MSYALVIRVRFHDGRYNGAGNWPPSPARLFQALVAAAGLNGRLAASHNALEWLQRQPSAPIVGAPGARRGQRVLVYMPNNDLDAVQGDPRRVARIRTATKVFSPWLFDASVPLLYLWPDVADADASHAREIASLSDLLYQFGRGIDMAWAWGELPDASRVDDLLAGYPGILYRPSVGAGGVSFPCPHPASLPSLRKRHAAYRHRFEIERKGRLVKVTFRQPPRPSFRPVAYESPPSRLLFELHALSSDSSLAPWPLVQASRLVVLLRDAAVRRLETALPDRRAELLRVLVGRKPDGSSDGPTAERVRIVPLASIGHPHADRAIRRVVVEVPAGCSLRSDDVAWAFSGLEPLDIDTGNPYPLFLTPALSRDMLRHYGVGDKGGARTWHTVTPAALPEAASREAEQKRGDERVQEQKRAAAAVMQALRHTDVRTRVESIRVQKEPFEANGERVEAFAPGTRFHQRRLWHVAVSFSMPATGIMVIGDGRFLGLGVMSPTAHRDE